MSIIIGYYESKKTDNLKIPIKNILKEIKNVFESLDIKVKQIDKDINKDTNKNIKSVLWVRDPFINIDKKYYIMNLTHNDSTGYDRRFEYLKVLPYLNKKFNIEIIPKNLQIEGGDIICDNKNIFIGINKRTSYDSAKYIKNKLTDYNIITINHNAIHLDCCLMILPGNKLFYSTRYIKNLPNNVKKSYECISVESIIGNKIDPILATNCVIINNNIITTDQAKFKKFRNYLRKLNYNVIEINYGNLWIHDGGIRCLIQWIDKPEDLLVY